MSSKKVRRVRKVLFFVSGAALTIAGFVMVPPLMKKYGNKLYRNSLKEEIDFESMGPEIIPFDKEERE